MRIKLLGLLLLSIVLVGCDQDAESISQVPDYQIEQILNKNFNMEYEGSTITLAGKAYLYKDADTDIEYIIFKTSEGGVGITPRITNN